MSNEFEQKQTDNFNQFGGGQQPVPNSVGALVLGILSLIFCSIGFILGTIAVILANQGEKMYQANPQAYTEASYKNLKAGKTCGIIGICLSAAVLILVIIYFVIVGSLIAGAAWH